MTAWRLVLDGHDVYRVDYTVIYGGQEGPFQTLDFTGKFGPKYVVITL